MSKNIKRRGGMEPAPAHHNGNGNPSPRHMAVRSLQHAIAEAERELNRAEQELTRLKNAYNVLETPEPQTILDRAEAVLRETRADKMHADDLVREIAARFHHQTTFKDLTNSINRDIHRKKARFVRPEPNTYALKQRT